jgi:hypothetical protein
MTLSFKLVAAAAVVVLLTASPAAGQAAGGAAPQAASAPGLENPADALVIASLVDASGSLKDYPVFVHDSLVTAVHRILIAAGRSSDAAPELALVRLSSRHAHALRCLATAAWAAGEWCVVFHSPFLFFSLFRWCPPVLCVAAACRRSTRAFRRLCEQALGRRTAFPCCGFNRAGALPCSWTRWSRR